MNRTKPDPVSDYFDRLAEPARSDLRTVDRLIRRWQPDLPVELWQSMGREIVGYGRAGYRLSRGRVGEWFIIGLAAHKSYLSLYLWGAVDGRYLLDHYQGRLGRVKTGRACLNFQSPADLDLAVLRQAVAQAVALQTPGPGSKI